MKIKELYEGAEPRLPGAVSGIKVMTPQQFAGQADEELNEFAPVGGDDREPDEEEILRQLAAQWWNGDEDPRAERTLAAMGWEIGQDESGDPDAGVFVVRAGDENGDTYIAFNRSDLELNEATAPEKEVDEDWKKTLGTVALTGAMALGSAGASARVTPDGQGGFTGGLKPTPTVTQPATNTAPTRIDSPSSPSGFSKEYLQKAADPNRFGRYMISVEKAQELLNGMKESIEEGNKHLARIRKLSGLAEATTLPASTRDLKGQEFQDYMNRIKGTDDIDKKTGQVKLDKKGNEKYVSGKTKSDKYKMPYIHRSSIIEYLGPDGKTYDEDKIKQSLSQRPKALLKQNEKMKHSNGEFEQFFNVGFAALTGIAVDEQTNNLIIVNTCPGAGSCKVDCFAMKGGKVQFKAAWQSDGRILTYLLNDPSGFFNQLSSEISKEEAAGKKGDKKFPNGWQTTVRWHDAGDFFSPEYLDMALKMAAKHPDVKFYAYTKMAGAALAQKPPNFIINWSEGANTSQEKQVKAKDANLDTTKNSRIVPDDLFQDLLVKDEKKNLVKGASGQWQVQPDKLPELKQRLASEYGLSANSILSYDEYMAKRKSIPAGMKYNVIVAPGEGDISANDPNIISTLLLRH